MLEIPEQLILMIDGQADPGGPAFSEAAEVLYSVAYREKFLSKKAPGIDGASKMDTIWRVIPLDTRNVRLILTN